MPETDTIPVSASVASTGTGIRYIGDFAYALSGTNGATTSPTTVLDFTTGNGLIVGKLQCNGNVHFVSPGAGATSIFRISFNSETIGSIQTETELSSTERGTPSQDTMPIIIPPFTHVVVTVDSTTSDADKLSSVILVGRVYGEK